MFSYRRFGALPLLPKHMWENQIPSTWDPSIGEIAQSGPYQVSAYVANESIILTRNAEYYPEIDADAPTLRSLAVVPSDPIPAESVVFRAYVDDRSLISNVTLSYTHQVGQINFTGAQLMIQDAAGFEGTIPAKVTASVVLWEIHATDTWGNTALIASGNYTSTMASENGYIDPTTLLMMQLSIVAVVVIIVLLIVRRKMK